jgi:hypothetical protein
MKRRSPSKSLSLNWRTWPRKSEWCRTKPRQKPVLKICSSLEEDLEFEHIQRKLPPRSPRKKP